MIIASRLSLLVVLAGAGFTTPASSGELLGHPPPDPPGTVVTKMTPDTIQNAMDEQLHAQFERAAGTSSNILTAERAKDAGWGLVADHFAQIDRDGDGFATFAEVQAFFDARSPVKQQRAKAEAAKRAQVIE